MFDYLLWRDSTVYLGGDTDGNDEEIDSPTQHDEERKIRGNIWECEIIKQPNLNYIVAIFSMLVTNARECLV